MSLPQPRPLVSKQNKHGLEIKRILKEEKEYKYDMKKSFYTLFLCFLCVFCPFLLVGCGENEVDINVVNQKNAFRIVRQANADDTIALAYVFPVNTEILLDKGLTENGVRTFRYYLSAYVGALAQQLRAKEVEGSKVGEVAYFKDVDGLGFTITFDNVDVQKRFFGNENEKDENEPNPSTNTKISGFFVKKSEVTTTFPISSKESAENLKQVCRLAMISWANLSTFPNTQELLNIYDESNFIYHFSSMQSALKSDICFDDENLHHNVFVKTQKDLADGNNTITFYATTPNTPAWYAFAVLVAFGGMAIAYFVLKKKKESGKSK